MSDNDKLFFAKEEETKQFSQKMWNILIVDDDQGIHDVTKLALKDFSFEDRKCHFISAYSAKEAEELLRTTPNIALAFIDVVMEAEDSGLNLINTIRKRLNNKLIRLVLRTGQPGQAPEEDIIYTYDINDYKSKSELTTQKLFTTTLTSLRNYRDLIALEKNRHGLFRIIESTSNIEMMDSFETFLSALLEQILALLYISDDTLETETPIFIAAIEDENCTHITGLGPYKDHTLSDVFCETDPSLKTLINEAVSTQSDIQDSEHLILFQKSKTRFKGFVLYMKSTFVLDDVSRNLIKIFLEKATIAYENAALHREMDETQKDIIFTLSEIAEQRSNETGKHVKRVSKYCAILAKEYGLSSDEINMLYAASPMHDIGKIAIPDYILKKADILSQEEFEVMKTHTSIGYKMLQSSTKEIFKNSAIIALQHHEKYDGSGYPQGLTGEEIHIFARITALADVYDALGSHRVYKKAWNHDDILELIRTERGKHFDPKLVDIFFAHLDKFTLIRETYKDTE